MTRAMSLLLVALAAVMLAIVVPLAIADEPPAAVTYQGKTIDWWARHAVQARKDANARKQTIVRLQIALRAHVPLGARTLASEGHLDAAQLERDLLCIHTFEAAWTNPGLTWDGRPSQYRGGMQMDSSFQRSYGAAFVRAFGSADHWTPAMQLAVAEIAYLSGRGFGPWHDSRRSCGL